MASSWVKSLQCKSRALEDVYDPTPNPKRLNPSASCRHSVADVIHTAKRRAKPEPPRRHAPSPPPPPRRLRSSSDATLTELPAGHPSRNVVEIIFHTSWSPKAFSGRVELIFKIHNGARAATRFEEHRDAVRARAGSLTKEDARCAADGNEVMGFHCLGPTPCDARAFPGAAKASSAVCTFSGSGAAHESAGAGAGTRAMLVCRVVAGRLGFDSVSRDGGELLVFDSRAVLPCFLIVYNL